MRLLSAAQRYVYGDFCVTGNSADTYQFLKEIMFCLLVFSSHAKYKSYIETKKNV